MIAKLPPELAKFLRKAIRDDERPPYQIALAAKVQPSTVTRLLRGSDIYTATADRLAKVLGISYQAGKGKG